MFRKFSWDFHILVFSAKITMSESKFHLRSCPIKKIFKLWLFKGQKLLGDIQMVC
jgi:hypothetical protein